MKPLIKKSGGLRNIVILVILVILVLAVLNFFQNEVRNFFYSISAPIQKTFWQMGNKVSDFFETIGEINNLKQENENLKLKVESLTAQEVSFKELKKENATLRNALNIGLEKDFRLIFCQVIGQDISQDILTIDKGSSNGVSKGQPVITPEKVLVGKISEVYQNFSKVQLVSNKDSSFDAKISDTQIYSLVKGYGSLRVFFDLVPKDIEIKKGDVIVTAAFGGIFPEGLLVGEIREVQKSDIEPFQKAEITTAFNVKELDHLFIIVGFQNP